MSFSNIKSEVRSQESGAIQFIRFWCLYINGLTCVYTVPKRDFFFHAYWVTAYLCLNHCRRKQFGAIFIQIISFWKIYYQYAWQEITKSVQTIQVQVTFYSHMEIVIKTRMSLAWKPPNPHWCPACLTPVLFIVSCQVGPRYNGSHLGAVSI